MSELNKKLKTRQMKQGEFSVSSLPPSPPKNSDGVIKELVSNSDLCMYLFYLTQDLKVHSQRKDGEKEANISSSGVSKFKSELNSKLTRISLTKEDLETRLNPIKVHYCVFIFPNTFKFKLGSIWTNLLDIANHSSFLLLRPPSLF